MFARKKITDNNLTFPTPVVPIPFFLANSNSMRKLKQTSFDFHDKREANAFITQVYTQKWERYWCACDFPYNYMHVISY